MAQKHISGQEGMKRKKNAFATLVLEFFCQSKFSYETLKTKKSKNLHPL
jgi:hypothetical protein